MTATKKLWLGLGVIIIVMLVILVEQIKTARSITTRAADLPLVSPNMIDIPTPPSDPILGNPGAPLTLVGFFDVTDEKSRDLYLEVSQLVKKNPDKIRLIWKDLPGTGFFVDPLLAHKALFCARQQKAFWPYADSLMTEKSGLREGVLKDLARQHNLNTAAFDSCLTDSAAEQAVATSASFAVQLGFPEAPLLFINNKLLNPEADLDLEQFLSTLITQ